MTLKTVVDDSEANFMNWDVKTCRKKLKAKPGLPIGMFRMALISI